MRVCLLNPPLSVHEFPHLALPMLKGYLSSRGIDCMVRDFNVEIMSEIIDEGLEKVQRYFYDRGVKYRYEEIKQRFDGAREVFWQKDSQGRDDRAQKLINTYLRIAGSNIFDVCFRPDTLEAIQDGYARCDLARDDNKIIRFLRERVLKYFERFPADVVGISVPFTSQIYYAFVLGREIKRLLPKARVVMGGPQISLFWRLFCAHEPFRQAFDAMIPGMGELALEEYLRAVEQGGGLAGVPSLVYFDEDGVLRQNPEDKLTRMSDLHEADFSDLPLEKYIYAKLPYQFSRGCYWGKCAFCSYRNNKGYMTRKTEEVLTHFENMERRYGIHNFQFIDDAIHPTLLDQMADQILSRGMKIRYDAYLRLEPGFTEELCRKLSKSGLKTVLFGFESANQRMLDLMNKGNTPSNMLRVLKNMHNAGIQSILSCLVGFPTETWEEAMDSIRFLKENRAYYYWVYIVHFGMISDMCGHAEDYGVVDMDLNRLVRYDDSGFAALGYPYRTTRGMTVEESLRAIEYGRRELGIRIFPDNFFS